MFIRSVAAVLPSQSLSLSRHSVGFSSKTPQRTYALSRFPERFPGASRKPRRRVLPSSSRSGDEDQSSSKQTGLWENAAQRPPSINPVERLEMLLLHHETLVVTRQVTSALVNLMVLNAVTNTGKLRC